jgi:hypothetical protein
MTDKKKTIIEEAVLDYKRIQDVIKSNSKEILRSIMSEEIEEFVKESVTEADYDEEDVDDTDMEATPETGIDYVGGEDEMEAGEDASGLDMDIDSEMGDDDMDDMSSYAGDMDMTNASDEDVISVYKKLSSNDEIEVISDTEVTIKDPESGAEYHVKLGGNKAKPVGDIDITDVDTDIDADIEPEMGVDSEIDLDSEMDVDSDSGMDIDIEANDAEEINGEESEEEEEEEEETFGEGVVFEIDLDDEMEDVNEETKIGATAAGIVRGKGHDTYVGGGNLPTGNIEGQKAPIGDDLGDNLEGGFEDDKTYANSEGDMVMSETEDVVEEAEDTEEVTEQIPNSLGKSKRLPGKETEIKGPGAQNEIALRYNKLLKEAKELKKENAEFKKALLDFRTKLTETAVFNTNLAYVTKLFMEHTTTKAEKKEIMGRFDEDVTSIKESQKLYKTIKNELDSKTPISESINSKLNKTVDSSSTKQLTESTVYVDESTKRINDLINRVEGRLNK